MSVPERLSEPAQLRLNELLRAGLTLSVGWVGGLFELEMRRRVARYRGDQARLARRFGLGAATPVRPYDEATAAAVDAYAACHPDARFAYTSGSTATPKRIAFTRARLAMIKRENLSVVARTMRHLGVRRPGLFIVSGLRDDDSLSTLILSDRGREPPYLEAVLMAARYLAVPAMAPLLERYGATAARLWLLTLSNPGIVYATNPSTLALFLTAVYEDWPASARLLRDHAADPGRFPPEVRRIARRVASPGWRERLARVLAAPEPVPMAELVPGLEVYCCWDGGYVRPFLDRVRQYLPAPRFRLVPMYSMSTETIETLNHYVAGEARFLALAPGVRYELLPDGAADDPALLVEPWAAEPGTTYALVVSDAYGLVRYQTEDLFLCAGHVGAVPDLRFLRRRGLGYSFTGEKLTDVQVVEAFSALRRELPLLAEAGVQLTLIPDRPDGALVPRYRLVLAHPGAEPAGLAALAAEAGRRFDALAGAANHEMAGKQASGRLGPTVAVVLPYDVLAAALDPKTRDAADRAGRVWDTQFKLLPIYRTPWKELRLS